MSTSSLKFLNAATLSSTWSWLKGTSFSLSITWRTQKDNVIKGEISGTLSTSENRLHPTYIVSTVDVAGMVFIEEGHEVQKQVKCTIHRLLSSYTTSAVPIDTTTSAIQASTEWATYSIKWV